MKKILFFAAAITLFLFVSMNKRLTTSDEALVASQQESAELQSQLDKAQESLKFCKKKVSGYIQSDYGIPSEFEEGDHFTLVEKIGPTQ
jgi:hypothetical protein